MALNLISAFTELPPPIDYVLPNMVAGTVGAIVSPGGVGKSMLALQLAAQIAGGPDLLDVGRSTRSSRSNTHPDRALPSGLSALD